MVSFRGLRVNVIRAIPGQGFSFWRTTRLRNFWVVRIIIYDQYIYYGLSTIDNFIESLYYY